MNKMLFCIGNPLKGDDGIAIALGKMAEQKMPFWQVIYGYDVPENELHLIRSANPDILVVADATVEENSEVNFMELSEENQYLASTHNIPLHVIIRYIKEFCPKVLFLALPICPKNAQEIKEGLSENAIAATHKGIEKLLYLDTLLDKS